MALNETLHTKSIYAPLTNNTRLHLKRFFTEPQGEVVFMVHGAVENGRIFYSNSHKGLAPFLAKAGFDVFVLDLRGRGKSTPAIDKNANYGQTESIVEDIPTALNTISQLRPNTPQHWIAHSWGGVLLASTYIRFKQYRANVKSQVYFGTKRRVNIKSLKRFFIIDIIWRGFCRMLTAFYGYLPAKKFRLGSDDETKKSHRQGSEWVKMRHWQDTHDNFDYLEKGKALEFPPTLFIAGVKDAVLGHPYDVHAFLEETPSGKKVFRLLAKKNGHQYNHDHISMLTHPSCEKDVFLEVVAWLKEQKIA